MQFEPALPASASRPWQWAAYAAIALATIVAYHNTLSVPELLDDPVALSENATLRTLWPPWAPFAPPADSGFGGRPFVNFTFAANYAVGGTDLRGYHVVNGAIHLGAALALFGLVRRTLAGAAAASGPSVAPLRDHATVLALSIALVWSVHPALTMAVTYLSQRTESLMGLCYLITLYAFARGSSAGAWRGWYAVSVATCAAGMATKEGMVTAPVMVLLYDRTFGSGSFGAALRQRPRYYAALAGTWLLLAALLTTGLHQRQVGFGLGVESWRYALTECRAVLHYLRLGVWPHPLVFDHGRVYLGLAAALPYLVAVLVLLALTVLALRRRPMWGFVATWFFVTLAPTSSVVPIAQQPIAENRLYVPIIAVVVAGMFALHAVAGRRLLVAAAAVIALAFTALAERRNAAYGSEIALWADTVRKRPDNPRAYDNLGQALHRAGRPQEAIPHYERALQLNPGSHSTHGLLGDTLVQLYQLEAAAQHYRRAIELKPDHAIYYNNLGALFARAGQRELAAEFWARTVQLAPNLGGAHANLGGVYFELGRFADAVPQFEQAIARGHDSPALRQQTGAALLQLGRPGEAVGHFERAAQASPNDADARSNFGLALAQAGRPADAATQFEAALRLNPNHTVARNLLAQLRGKPAP